jgi:hypothetical protein
MISLKKKAIQYISAKAQNQKDITEYRIALD